MLQVTDCELRTYPPVIGETQRRRGGSSESLRFADMVNHELISVN
jgi:hypothetical protein